MVRVYSRKKTCWFLRNLVQMDGSVFPMATLVSLPAAIAAAALVKLHDTEYFRDFFDREDVEHRIFTNSAVWSSFTFLVGFLVVFRTSHAYNRFWEACASVHKMGAEWFDACSALIAYTKVSKAEQVTLIDFQNKVIRLFSLLHAVALAELEDLDNGAEEFEVQSFEMEIVDAGAFADETLLAIRDSTCRVELVYQWIQSLIVEAHDSGILDVPAPILTRSFQELSGGMVNFHEAIKVADTAFPFPYSQTCDVLLFFLYIFAPFVASTYCYQWWLAFLFTFIWIFTYACLTLTGLELEFPYGKDPNDIQGLDLQLEMNQKLRLLIAKVSWHPPKLRKVEAAGSTQLQNQRTMLGSVIDANPWSTRSLSVLWEALPETLAPSMKYQSGGAHSGTSQGSSSMMKASAPGGGALVSEPSGQVAMAHVTDVSSARQGGATFSQKSGKLKAARRGARVRARRMRNVSFARSWTCSDDDQAFESNRYSVESSPKLAKATPNYGMSAFSDDSREVVEIEVEAVPVLPAKKWSSGKWSAGEVTPPGENRGETASTMDASMPSESNELRTMLCSKGKPPSGIPL